jgi:hypothetical protein
VSAALAAGGAGVGNAFEKVGSATVAKPGYSTTIVAGFMGRDCRRRSTMRELADARRWIACVATRVGREDMVGELGVMSCHIGALDVGVAVNPRRPCDRRNKGKCPGACR